MNVGVTPTDLEAGVGTEFAFAIGAPGGATAVFFSPLHEPANRIGIVGAVGTVERHTKSERLVAERLRSRAKRNTRSDPARTVDVEGDAGIVERTVTELNGGAFINVADGGGRNPCLSVFHSEPVVTKFAC